ncbi:MAG: hypothetical protein M1600_06510 [Firmicutes bacterium]|nr:hypothetical protein [Bacillota bacterium]
MKPFKVSHTRQVTVLAATVLTSLALASTPILNAAPVPATTTASSETAAASGHLTTPTTYAAIGQQVPWRATNLPPNQTVRLVWEHFAGHWQVDGPNLIGAQYQDSEQVLASVHPSSSGTASGTFAVPLGFGGEHTFGLENAQGQTLATTAVIVTMTAQLAASSEPDGGFFTLSVSGLGYGGGYNNYNSEYGVLYDNHYMGFLSGVTTEGHASFRVRAEGVGTHVISIINSPVEGSYLNLQQSPYPWFGQFDWTVEVTPAVPHIVVSHPVATATQAVGTHLTLTPGSGYVGSHVTWNGQELPKNAALTLQMNTESGNRVTASSYTGQWMTLGTTKTNAAGTFVQTLKVPEALGGPAHPVRLLDGTQVVGSSHYRIMPHLIGVSPTVVQEGQSFAIHLTGVGWTEYDNIYAVDYDNGYTGYGCGFNSNGDVQIILRAAGTPGYHFIDLYPSPYKGATDFPTWCGMPQLTYAQDHPGDTLPAFHVVIRVVP